MCSLDKIIPMNTRKERIIKNMSKITLDCNNAQLIIFNDKTDEYKKVDYKSICETAKHFGWKPCMYCNANATKDCNHKSLTDMITEAECYLWNKALYNSIQDPGIFDSSSTDQVDDFFLQEEYT